jgi:3-(3-hydroxy-phenyl)propionate hydroxylase
VGGYVAEILGMDESRTRLAAEISGLDIRYDLGEGHALLERRTPALDLVTANGPRRVFTVLYDARPVTSAGHRRLRRSAPVLA